MSYIFNIDHFLELDNMVIYNNGINDPPNLDSDIVYLLN